MIRLDRLAPDDLRPVTDAIRGFARSGGSIEDAARSTAHLLYETLVGADGKRACPLVRVYKAHRYADLDPDLQAFARRLLDYEPDGSVRCLTLLGTAGDEPAWNDRLQSVGHQAIPLPSLEFVQRLPMVAELIRQLGLDIRDVLHPPEALPRLAQQTYDVFHVEEARGSPFLPAQDFIERYGIASAVGFGGVLLSGDFYACLLFSATPISARIALTLKVIALPLRVALTPMVGRPVFADR